MTVAAAVGVIACDTRLETTGYTVKCPKLKSSVRIAFISDLHNSLFGEKQSQLISAVNGASPDIIVFGGDLADKTQDFVPENSFFLAEYLAGKYPCFYSIGNHENARGDSARIKQQMSLLGVCALEGSGEVISVNDNEIEICGIYDAYTYDEQNGELVNQLEAVTSSGDDERLRLLIAHFPEQIDEYLTGNFDIVLSGHAHGGQWRIPGLIDGVYAPGQGLFPKYTSGVYMHGETAHIVSRGLWKPSTLIAVPRVFNRPELVIIDIKP